MKKRYVFDTLHEAVSILRTLRLHAGLSQATLGKLIGLPKQRVSEVERYLMACPEKLYAKWADACGYELSFE